MVNTHANISKLIAKSWINSLMPMMDISELASISSSLTEPENTLSCCPLGYSLKASKRNLTMNSSTHEYQAAIICIIMYVARYAHYLLFVYALRYVYPCTYYTDEICHVVH